jgi:hypothetical protein
MDHVNELSLSQLDSEAFSILRVVDHNYDEVDNLTLDNNNLDTFPEKLLDMKLKLSFSAKDNLLTNVIICLGLLDDRYNKSSLQIPYDFSQRLILSTNVIQLSKNPWKCTCSSQITDLVNERIQMFSACVLTFNCSFQNLLAKTKDKSELLCGPASELELVSKRVGFADFL